MKETLLYPPLAAGRVRRRHSCETRAPSPMISTILLLQHDVRPRLSLDRADKAGYTVLPAGDSCQAVHLYLMHDVRLLLVFARQRVLEASIAV